MTRHAWLIPLGPAPAALRMTLGALDDCDVSFTTLSPGQVREQLAEHTPPAALVHGGVATSELFDVQRWLAEFHVPTLVLVEGLTDLYEASLLDRGAQDVVAIPVSTRKLRSRLDALLRPVYQGPWRSTSPSSVSAGSIEIRPRQRTVEVGGHQLNLTALEFDLLMVLAMNQGDVVSRSELAVAVGRAHLSDRALESHISRIRVKLRAAGSLDRIASVRSIGYRLQMHSSSTPAMSPR